MAVIYEDPVKGGTGRRIAPVAGAMQCSSRCNFEPTIALGGRAEHASLSEGQSSLNIGQLLFLRRTVRPSCLSLPPSTCRDRYYSHVTYCTLESVVGFWICHFNSTDELLARMCPIWILSNPQIRRSSRKKSMKPNLPRRMIQT